MSDIVKWNRTMFDQKRLLEIQIRQTEDSYTKTQLKVATNYIDEIIGIFKRLETHQQNRLVDNRLADKQNLRKRSVGMRFNRQTVLNQIMIEEEDENLDHILSIETGKSPVKPAKPDYQVIISTDDDSTEETIINNCTLKSGMGPGTGLVCSTAQKERPPRMHFNSSSSISKFDESIDDEELGMNPGQVKAQNTDKKFAAPSGFVQKEKNNQPVVELTRVSQTEYKRETLTKLTVVKLRKELQQKG